MAKRMKAGPLDESLIIQSFKDADLLADPANAVLQEAGERPAASRRDGEEQTASRKDRAEPAAFRRDGEEPVADEAATTRYISNAGNSRRGSPFTSVRRYTAPSSSWYTCWRSRARRSA